MLLTQDIFCVIVDLPPNNQKVEVTRMQNEKILIEGKFSKFWDLPWVFLFLSVLTAVLGVIADENGNEALSTIMSVFLILFFVIMIYLFVLSFGMRKYQIVVTDRRVYGIARFGKRVDLPLDSVSAIGTSLFKTVAVATSSGKIRFMFLENLDDVYKTLNDLLLHRQGEAKKSPVSEIVMQSDPADQLKKYKELLDSGVISQEEFDAKKKQLLGL